MKKVITSIFVLGLLTLAFAEDYGANDLYQNIKSSYGSKDSINENVNKPTTGVNDFKTVDNSTSFNAPMECPSSQIAVLISFSQDGGDYRAIIKIDRDLDGNFDYTYTTINISGVCTNGIVNCDKGTWNNCNFYYWKANNDKSIILEPTSDTKLVGSCSCANASCGITQLDQPLFSMIGGGISQVLMNVDSNFLISKSKWNGNNLELFGQAPKDCSKPDFNSYGESNPEQYYKNQIPPSVSIADIASQQGNDPYSPYSIVEPVSNLEYEAGKKIGLPQISNCVIRNTVTDGDVSYYSDGGCFLGNSNPCNGSVEKLSGNKFKCYETPLDNGCGQTYNVKLCGSWETTWSIPDDESVYIEINGTVIKQISRSGDGDQSGSGSCSGDTTLGSASCGDTKYLPSSDFVNAKFEYKNLGRCNGIPSSSLSYIFIARENLGVSKTDSCPTGCELVNEWVCDKDGNNCIQTVVNGNPTSSNLTIQCFNYQGRTGSYIVCSDGNEITAKDEFGEYKIGEGWFYIKREYNCGEQNLDIDLSRTRYVAQNTTQEGNIISYTDVNGSKESLDLSSVEKAIDKDCKNPICLVKVPKKDTTVFSDKNNKSQLPSNGNSSEYVVVSCIELNGSLNCTPPEGGEIVEDCRCNLEDLKSGFELSVSSLEILNQASKDMICSSSPP